MRLNVTRDAGEAGWEDYAIPNRWWGYIVVNGAAHKVAYGTIDALREYASANGYEGILIGAPSVPFFQVVICVGV
jgi:hypothetical protein